MELANDAKHPELYGNALAQAKRTSIEEQSIYKLVESEDLKLIQIATTFIRIAENKSSLKTQLDNLDALIISSLSMNGVIRFLLSLRASLELWKHIEGRLSDVESAYWKAHQNYLYIDTKEELSFALEKLLKYKKSIVFLNTLGMNLRLSNALDLTSEEILSFLEEVPILDFDDNSSFDHNSFQNILDVLYSKNDYEERGAKIERKFFFVFRGDYSPKPKNLFKLMSRNPVEYIGMLCQIYLPTDEKLRDHLQKQIEESNLSQTLFEFTYPLFDSFNNIPSYQEDGSLNAEELNQWISGVRELAVEKFVVDAADRSIGKLLAKYPINISKGEGFAVEIYDALEEINSEEMLSAFGMQISNNLGFTSRGAFEGGNIERARAEYFNLLFENTRISHSSVSLVFKNLRDYYLYDAKDQDGDALLRSFR